DGARLGVGSVSIWATDVPVMIRLLLPPKNCAMSGVRSRKVVLTRTVAVCPMPGEQSLGLHCTVRSDGAIEIDEPRVSRIVRHTTRFDSPSLGHGWPARYELGVTAAWNAPSRAALLTATCVKASRPRSSTAA